MNGNHQCAAALDIDPRQRYFTTVQPFSYRDTLTVLGYVQEVADHLEELRGSLDDLAKDENADMEAVDGILKEITAWRASVDTALDDLEKKLDGYQDSTLTYNPTTGRYEDSKNTDRDMYRELAVFGARVDQMATLTCAQAADHDCLTWAAIGNQRIFGDDKPRVTPRGRKGMAG